MDAIGLRRLLKIKNKELRHMKELAATIISQRSETEQFFLESLAEVKEIIKYEKKNGARSAAGKGGSNRNNTKGFPPLVGRSSSANNASNNKTLENDLMADNGKVTIQDLSWEDKELVLRVLFAKMNGTQRRVQSVVAQQKKLAPAMQSSDPVFISEGAGHLTAAESANYEDEFEIQVDNSELGSLGISVGEDEEDYM